MRRAAIRLPRINPCSVIAVIAYSEQLGSNRQAPPMNGPSSS